MKGKVAGIRIFRLLVSKQIEQKLQYSFRNSHQYPVIFDDVFSRSGH
jgi:hypothetical protein